MSHILKIVLAGSTAGGFIFAVIYTLTKNAEIRYWVGGAWAAFVNGFIEGAPVGSPAGAGIALADNEVHADLGIRHLAIEAAHVLAVPFFTGLADVRSFTKDNPFPNPFKPPIVVSLQLKPKTNEDLPPPPPAVIAPLAASPAPVFSHLPDPAP